MQCRRSVVCGLAVLAVLVLGSVLVYILGQDLCGSGTFQCGNSSVCVPQRFVCNEHPDCPQGEDEDKAICADFHGKNFINELLGRAQGKKPPHFYNCDLTGVPGGCTCRNHTRLFCKNIGLTAVPQYVSSNATRMVLLNNSIQNVSQDSFSRYNLELINLAMNGIEDLNADVFYSQTQLQKLALDNNRLSTLRPGLLRGLRALEWLYLDYNRLSTLQLSGLQDLVSLSWFDLSHNNLTLEDQIFPPLTELRYLRLGHNSIRSVDRQLFQELSGLSILVLCWNSITFVHPEAFLGQPELKELDLSYNQLRTLSSPVFEPLARLSKLSLAANPFRTVPSQLFSGISNLSSLDLQEIDIQSIDLEIFPTLRRLQRVYLKTFHYCMYAPNVRSCKPNTDGVSSSRHLLARPMLRATLWLVATLTCMGNALVLWGRFTARDENRELNFVIRNLAVSDLLMGAYLLVIGAQDVQTRGQYSRQAHGWMSSWLCTVSGVLAMMSSEVSMLILVFLSLERFLLIAVPFGGHQKLSMRIAGRSLALIWAAGLCLAVIPAVHWRHSTRFYGTSGMCFPLHIDDPFLLGWQYSAFIVLGLNTTGLVLIAMLYAGMFVSIWQTRHATPVTSVRDLEFVVRFFFIVLTDAGCWAPIIVLKLMAMARVHISADLYAWVVVFVLPVNSAVNPLLYTFTTPRYRGRLRQLKQLGLGGKPGRSHSAQSSLVARRHSTMDTDYSSNRNVICTAIGVKKKTAMDLCPTLKAPAVASLN